MKKSVKKAEAILNGAIEEFLKNGYAATTMDQIAKTAGISKATVYNHFGDKETLFAAIIEHLAQEKFQTIFDTEHPELMEKEPQIVLRYLAHQMLKNGLNDQQFHGFIRIIIGESGRFPHLGQIYLHHLVKPALERLNQYLLNQEQFTNTDTEAMVRIFVGTLVHFVILQSLLDGKDIVPMESDRLVDTLVNLLDIRNKKSGGSITEIYEDKLR
ncbi:MAG: TetR/AcrR family transcriptional regulator [Microcystaceae cyanobacterium]